MYAGADVRAADRAVLRRPSHPYTMGLCNAFPDLERSAGSWCRSRAATRPAYTPDWLPLRAALPLRHRTLPRDARHRRRGNLTMTRPAGVSARQTLCATWHRAPDMAALVR